MNWAAALMLSAVCALSGAWAGPTGASEPLVKVGVLEGVESVCVSAAAPLTVTPGGGSYPRQIPADATWMLRAAGESGLELVSPDDGVVSLEAKSVTVSFARNVGGVASGIVIVTPIGAFDTPTRLHAYRGEVDISRSRAGGLLVVNRVRVEDYLRGVVPCEMGDTYPIEALKAQAIAARTQALAKLSGRTSHTAYQVCATVHCQVYAGMSAERPSTDEAVRATRGEVLTFQGQLATAVYHAICGGHTESNESVWGGSPVPYLRGRPDTGADAAEWGDLSSEAAIGAYLAAATANCARPEFCRVDRFRWERTNTVEDLAKSLPAAIGRLREITPVKRGISGRIEALKVTGDTGSLVIKRELPIRRALGNLPSAAFTAEALRDAEGNLTGFRFRGAGWGHGVGMCQVGAAGSAAAGKTYRQILEFYYRGCEISRRWD